MSFPSELKRNEKVYKLFRLVEAMICFCLKYSYTTIIVTVYRFIGVLVVISIMIAT